MRYADQILRASNPVVAIAVPNDVYLAYSISVFLGAMHVVSFPLNVRIDSAQRPASRQADHEKSSESSRFLKPLPGAPPCISYLGTKPYTMSLSLARPSTSHVALVPDQRARELRVTPDTLRFLGQQVEQFMKQIRDVQVAYKEAVNRNELQKQEHARQINKLAEMRSRLDALKNARRRKAEEHAARIRDMQGMLMSRLDAVLQATIKRANPELSDQEKRWFDELKRMEGEVLGRRRQDEDSLRGRIALVCSFCFLIPSIMTHQVYRYSSSVSMSTYDHNLRKREKETLHSRTRRRIKIWVHHKS
jgi:nucleoporin NUP82